MSASTPPPPPTSVLFARGVLARLAYWPALRIAVDHLWGGPHSAQKRTWLASVLVDDFESASPTDTPDADYVAERLLQVMADEFDANLEDGSAEAVAADLVRLWADVSAGRTALLAEFEERADRLKGKAVQVEEAPGDNSDWEDESEDEDEDGEDGEDEAPPLLERPPKDEPEVDADGFITVKGKGKSHR